MSNPEKGVYTLSFFDPPRRWKVSQNEEVVIEAELEVRRGEKVPIDTWLLGMIAGWTAQDWRLFLWAGCRHFDKKVTEEQLGGEMTGTALMQFKVVATSFYRDRIENSPVPTLKKNVDAIGAAIQEVAEAFGVEQEAHGQKSSK